MPGLQYMPGAWHIDRVVIQQQDDSVEAVEVAEKTLKEAEARQLGMCVIDDDKLDRILEMLTWLSSNYL